MIVKDKYDPRPIERARFAAGLSIQALADASRIGWVTADNVLRGRAAMASVVKVCRTLGIDHGKLYGKGGGSNGG